VVHSQGILINIGGFFRKKMAVSATVNFQGLRNKKVQTAALNFIIACLSARKHVITQLLLVDF
jgi:hypothetical protein